MTRADAARPRGRPRTQPTRPRLSGLLARTLVSLVLMGAGAALASSYTYDVSLYNRYVSHGAWRTHSTLTNSTSLWVGWRVSLSTRSCTELSGAVSLALAARIASQRSSCTTSSREMATFVAPFTSTALKHRDVLHYDYYRIHKVDRYTGRIVDTGYATRKDTFTDHAFSSRH